MSDQDTPDNIRVKRELREQDERDYKAFLESERESEKENKYLEEINKEEDRLTRIENKLDLLLEKLTGIKDSKNS